MGYNYHGGHTNTPWPAIVGDATWVSPQRLTDNPGLVLLSDMNDGRPVMDKPSRACQGGPLLEGMDTSNQNRRRQFGRSGRGSGNVGLLDGSVTWKASNRCAFTAAPTMGRQRMLGNVVSLRFSLLGLPARNARGQPSLLPRRLTAARSSAKTGLPCATT